MKDQDLNKMTQERHFSPTQKIIQIHSLVKRIKAFGTSKGKAFLQNNKRIFHKQDQNTCFS